MVVVVEFVVVELVVWLCALPLYCLVYLYQTYQGRANLRMLKSWLGLDRLGQSIPGLEGEGVETAGSGNLIGCAETGLTGFDGLTIGADNPKRSGC